MLGKEELYKKISEYYLKAKEYLDRDNWKMAFNTLYRDMPQDLYDLSIDLWGHRNNRSIKDNERDLINLIEEVDLKLNPLEDDRNDD